MLYSLLRGSHQKPALYPNALGKDILKDKQRLTISLYFAI